MGKPSKPTPGGDGLAASASSSALWTVIGIVGSNVVRLGANLILTRLLLTEDFGLMALVNVFIMGLHLFSDMGFGPAIIQHEREDADFVNTIWTILVIRGLVLCLIAVALAGPYAAFYSEPRIASLIRVASVSLIIDGLMSTAIFTHGRHLKLKRPIALRFGVQVVSAMAMVAWAWVTRSVWALVVGNIVHSLLLTTLTHVWLPGIRNRFRLEKGAAQYLFSFGTWIFLGTIAGFLAAQLDRIIFGRITDMGTLGVYNIAVMLAVVPGMAVWKLALSVLFPFYTRVHYSSADLAKVFVKGRWPVVMLAGWIAAGFIGGGDTIIRLLYDPRYYEAGWILQVLSVGVWLGAVLGGTHFSIVLAVGRSDLTARMAFAKVVAIVVLVPAGYLLWGFPGAVVAISTAELFRYGVSLLSAVHLGFDGRLEDVKLSLRVGVSALAGWAAVAWLDQQGVTNVVLHAVVIFVVVTAFWALPLFVLAGRLLRRESIFADPADLAGDAA